MFARNWLQSRPVLTIAAIALTFSLRQPLFGQDGGDAQPSSNDGFHLLTMMRPGGLTLLSVPSSRADDQSVVTRTVESWLPPSQTRFLGVARGHLICIPRNPMRLAAIDLHDGTVRELTDRWTKDAVVTGDHVYFVAFAPKDDQGRTNALMHLNLSTMETSQLAMLQERPRQMVASSGPQFMLAASPLGERIAVIEFAPVQAKPGESIFPMSPTALAELSSPTARLLVANCETGTVERLDSKVPTHSFATGGGGYRLLPTLAWDDHDHIMMAQLDQRFVPKLKTLADGSVIYSSDQHQGWSLNARTPLELVTIDVDSLEEVDRFRLPSGSAGIGEPRFSRTEDGQTLIHLGDLGPHRVNLDDHEVREHSGLPAGYSLEVAGSHRRSRLAFNDVVLEPLTLRSSVFVSPDAKHVAWLPSLFTAWGSPDDQRVVDFKVHTAGLGVRTIARAAFPRRHSISRWGPSHTMFWCTDDDLVAGDQFARLPELEVPKRPPHVDRRPEIAESIEVKLETDKQEYLRHEPIKVTITVTNLTDDAIRYESKRALSGTQPFSSLDVRWPRGRSSLDWFEAGLDEPTGAEIVFPPGQPVKFIKVIDVGGIGAHEIHLSFKDSKWSGSLDVTSPFTVLDESTNKLFYAKFDRIMAVCRKQLEETGNAARTSDFRQMGDEAAPLLIETIRECDDPEFCKHLGRALRATYDINSLPFLEKLFAAHARGESIPIELHDAVECLWNLCNWRGVQGGVMPAHQAARDLVFRTTLEAKTGTPSALGLMNRSVMPEIDEFMWLATDATNVNTATTAARYIARRQQVPLKKWFALAAEKPNRHNLLAARSIITELRKTFGNVGPTFSEQSVDQVLADAKLLDESVKVLRAWTSWAVEHTRQSAGFFERERDELYRYSRLAKIWGENDRPPALVLPDEF